MSIKFEDVNFSYDVDGGTLVALKNISFDVRDGEFLSVIGHTGSGKSTLIQMINGLLLPTSGTVTVDGLDTKNKQQRKLIRKKVALSIQYPEKQLFAPTVAEDVAFGPKNLGFSPSDCEDICRQSMEKVGLDFNRYKNRSPFELSGGEKRRVALAGVIACHTKYIIIDEPTSGLDPNARIKIIELIKQLNNAGTTVIMVSHNMDDIARCSNRILVLKQGQVFTQGDVDEVFSRASELREINLGTPVTTNFIVKLNKMGFDIKENIYDVGELADVLAEKIHGVKNDV
jgi:energy-coupling factor transport system ATP-binding protein